MKKFLALILAALITLLMGTSALAETIDISNLTLDELKDLQTQVEARIAELRTNNGGGSIGANREVDEEAEEAEEAEESEYTELSKGSKGDEVKKLQQRLKDLNYLSGSVDGSYGNGTASAVSAFQQAADLKATGVADAETQKALFSDDAPKSKVYKKLNYKEVARDPDQHEGDLITFSGKILQVMESGSLIVFRISSKGNWDDVVYCTYYAPDNYSRFLEDDKVTVYGECTGIYTYETIMGGSVTIPSCTIDRIELRK